MPAGLNPRALLLLVAAVAGSAVTARLGLWQLDRGHQKDAVQAELDSRRVLPPLPAAELARTEAQAKGQHWRAIEIEGRWVRQHTVYLDNRPMNGHAGFLVVTPLALPDGSAVAVQRGWLPRDPADRTKVQAPTLPEGVVRLGGRIAPPPSQLYEIGTPVGGPIRQNLDLAAWAAEVGQPLRPLSIVQEEGPLTAADGLGRQWPRPAADVAKHYGYAFQWFAFSALIAGLYVWFQLIRPRRPGR
ncbi:MAG: SURF1 family protein [Rubrivivax sp.]